MMNKYIAIVRNVVWLTCFVFFLGSCEKPAETPPTPQILRQKIAVQETPPPPQKDLSAQQVTTTFESAKDTLPAQTPLMEPKPEIAKPAKEDSKATDKDSISQAPDIPEISPYTSRREEIVKVDPFMPLFKEEKPEPPKQVDTAKKETKKRVPLTPLEKIDLSQLKLVGIIRSPSGDKALVEEANGKGYIVTKGTYIGINSGRIIGITENGIIVEEEIEDVLGKVIINKTELKLQKPPGEL